jgi:hypothetical protein
MFIATFKTYEMLKSNSQNPIKKIFIRGAGTQGKRLFMELRKLGIHIDGFVTPDNDDFVEHTCLELPVIPPNEIYNLPIGSYFVIISLRSNFLYNAVKAEMEQNGLKECIDFYDFGVSPESRMITGNDFSILDIPTTTRGGGGGGRYSARENHKFNPNHIKHEKEIWGDAFNYNEKLYTEIVDEHNPIVNMNLMVGERCTLNCKSCISGMPLFSTPKHYDANSILKDLEKVLSVNRLINLSIIGGEPLVHPNLAEIILGINRIDNIGTKVCYVKMSTNATVEMSEQAINAFSDLNTVVPCNLVCSNYGKKSPKISSLTERLTARGIPVHIGSENWSFSYLGEPSFSRNYTSEQLKHVYSVCKQPMICTALADGKFYSCSYVVALDKSRICPRDENLYVDVRNIPVGKLRQKLEKFAFETECLSACQYCDGMYGFESVVPRAIQLKRGCYDIYSSVRESHVCGTHQKN